MAYDFQASLVIDTANHNQKIERSICIVEDEVEVANFYQLVQIKEQEQDVVANLIIEELSE